MTYRALPCFKAYDVRGRIGLELDGDVAYRVGRAVAQHFEAKSVVVGFDARETSPEFAGEVAGYLEAIGAGSGLMVPHCCQARSRFERSGMARL